MMQPADRAARTQFIETLGENFSVIAAAGSGKTRAITERIVALARSPHAEEWLPTLVVVTYTNRAADEMRRRARADLLAAGVPLSVHAAFGRAFFGTIHSFCLRLLRQHGHVLGLPGRFEPLDDDTELWREFVQRQQTIGASLGAEQRRALFRLAPARRVLELGRLAAAHLGGADPGPFPEIDCSDVHRHVGKGNSAPTVEASQARLREWERAWCEGDGFAPLPAPTSKAAAFTAAWDGALAPIREWLRRAALRVAAETARAYRDFRTGKGVLTFDDQVALARELLRHPETARRIRSANFRVILDEAQDTDPVQFGVLLEVARPPEAGSDWLAGEPLPPRAGHFCMVGDFQQSIYGARADLAHYRLVHDTLLRERAASSIEFSVTFRLDRASLDFVNSGCAHVLDGSAGQVGYVTLSPRADVLPGQVLLGAPGRPSEGDDDFMRHEAAWLARWLRDAGLGKLRAPSWRDVAILCPRKGWFAPLRAALRAEGLDVQLQSERDLKADSPAVAWLTALVVCLAEPHNGFEIAGLLREVFGVSDDELAEFVEGGGALEIETPRAAGCAVAGTLRLLADLRARVATRPLFTALSDALAAVQLRARLLSLPAEEFGDLSGELEDLLTLAASEEAAGKTLASFAERLRREFVATREVRGDLREAVQLITSQKSKGSEWACVIVPFFGREIRAASPKYPRLVRHPASGEWLIALEKHDVSGELKEALDARQRQEMERLLYVTLTRAKHTLVLVDDRELFATKSGSPASAQARLLRTAAGEKNVALLEALPSAPAECAQTTGAQRERAICRESAEPLPECARDVAACGRERAQHFIKRNPSALAEEADPETAAMPRPLAPNAGQLHGTWWHGFVENLDWSATPEAWDSIFAGHVDAAPDARRARAEWEKLRAQLTGPTPIASWLRGPGVRRFAEMPFLWRMNAGECLEGVIDLAVFDPAREAWLIVDWKTNVGAPAELHAHYAPQLAAYWRAIGDITSMRVEAALYATSTGTWLPYDERVLRETWTRISGDAAALTTALAEP